MKPLGTLAHQQHAHQDSIQLPDFGMRVSRRLLGNCKTGQSEVLGSVSSSCCVARWSKAFLDGML